MSRQITSDAFYRILRRVEKGEIGPLYFLHGEETFLSNWLIQSITQSLIGDQKEEFNRHVIYGKETDGGELLSAIKGFPVFADRKLVIVKEAERLRKPVKEELGQYVSNPVESTCLVVVVAQPLVRRL